MEITGVSAAFFSPTGSTRRVVTTMAEALAQKLGVELTIIDFTLPSAREKVNAFSATQIVVFGTPVYAGRIPNKMLPYIRNGFVGNGALAVPVAVYGNRSFGDALMELRNELESDGFHTIAGAAIPVEHTFSDKLATGRPNAQDMADIAHFGVSAAEKAAALTTAPEPVSVAGNDPVGPYYTPLGSDGKPAVFLKAKPKTDPDKCDRCGVCAQLCPIGSIPAEAPDTCEGVCIKCYACVKGCPKGAKYFDDAAFLDHVGMVVKNYARRVEAEWFI